MNMTSHQLCFFSKTGLNGAVNRKKPLNTQMCWEESEKCGLLSDSVLLSSGCLQAEKAENCLKKKVTLQLVDQLVCSWIIS